MASVVTFWQLPGEEDAFFRYLARDNELVAIRHMEAVTDPTAIRPVLIEEVIGRTDAGRLYLSLRPVTVGPLPLHCFEPKSPGEPSLVENLNNLPGFPSASQRSTRAAPRPSRDSSCCAAGSPGDKRTTSSHARAASSIRPLSFRA